GSEEGGIFRPDAAGIVGGGDTFFGGIGAANQLQLGREHGYSASGKECKTVGVGGPAQLCFVEFDRYDKAFTFDEVEDDELWLSKNLDSSEPFPTGSPREVPVDAGV